MRLNLQSFWDAQRCLNCCGELKIVAAFNSNLEEDAQPCDRDTCGASR
jgi:hypothetical protein